MLWILLGLALAADVDVDDGLLVVPIVPTDTSKSYSTLVKSKNASASSWKAEIEPFVCEPAGDYVEVRLDGDAWPSELPKKVSCISAHGKKATAAVRIKRGTYNPAFVLDGTLVMPRKKGTSVLYKGPLPVGVSPVVGAGKAGSLDVLCKVVPGPTLQITVAPEHPDGSGRCALKDREGKAVWIDIRIITYKPMYTR